MNKTILKLAFIVPGVVGALVLASVLAFNAVRHVIIEDNEQLVHSVAQSILPALLANDTQQVEALMKALESYPGVQSAELISAQGASIASYSRSGQSLDPSAISFELAGVEDDPNHLYLMAPITFDSLIVANLHIAVNLWPMYLRIMTWLGLLLMVPSIVYVLIKQLRVKLRFEVVEKANSSNGNGDGTIDIQQTVGTAMSDADISLEFQPIQRMSDAGFFGMEVLVCWRHPSGQTLHVSPADFVALAESIGICLPFDDWLLTSACQQAAVWQHKYGPLILTINISASQFNDPAFAKRIRKICDQTQYPHQLLELEVNESLFLRQPNKAMQNIKNLSDHGLSVTVDNFGLRNGSLELLGLFSISKVKLDKNLVKRIRGDRNILDLVKSTITHAVSHEVQVIADGLEAVEQKDILQNLGCILGQGTYFQPPLSERDFELYLADRPFNISQGSTLDVANAFSATDFQASAVH